MPRPEAFLHPHIAFRNTPCLREPPSRPAPGESPTRLLCGQIVWTRSRFTLGEMPARTVAFVDELGLISLDPRWLVPAANPVQNRPAPSLTPLRSVLRSVS